MDLTTTAESSVEEPQPLDSLAGGVFVGRQREMGELKACLEDALSGRGRLVTLAGEPGIGKTRTAQELALALTESGDVRLSSSEVIRPRLPGTFENC